MGHRQTAALALLVALGVAVMVPAVAMSDLGTATAVQESSADNETEPAGLGAQVSSFAQATAADADSGIDRGLWEVQANETVGDNQTAELITDRAAELERRLAALQNRTERLEQNRENTSDAAYTARASALRSQIANVRSAIEQANRTATSRGVDTEQLGRLRNNAANLTGPEVSDIARNITDAPRGPPEGIPGRGGPSAPGPRQADEQGRVGVPDSGEGRSGQEPRGGGERGNGSVVPADPGGNGVDRGNDSTGEAGPENGGPDSSGPPDANDPNRPNDPGNDERGRDAASEHAEGDDTDDSSGSGSGPPENSENGDGPPENSEDSDDSPKSGNGDDPPKSGNGDDPPKSGNGDDPPENSEDSDDSPKSGNGDGPPDSSGP
jgi:hypothetical protein